MSLSAKPFPQKSNSERLHDEKLFSNDEDVNFLLLIYPTGSVIAHALKYLKNYVQAPGVAHTELAKKLYFRAPEVA